MALGITLDTHTAQLLDSSVDLFLLSRVDYFKIYIPEQVSLFIFRNAIKNENITRSLIIFRHVFLS